MARRNRKTGYRAVYGDGLVKEFGLLEGVREAAEAAHPDLVSLTEIWEPVPQPQVSSEAADEFRRTVDRAVRDSRP